MKPKKPKPEPKPLTKTELKKIEKFRKKLQAHCDEHGFEIVDNGWANAGIMIMALDKEHRCKCRPDTRKCPCPESINEVLNTQRGMCTCSVIKYKV